MESKIYRLLVRFLDEVMRIGANSADGRIRRSAESLWQCIYNYRQWGLDLNKEIKIYNLRARKIPC